MLIAGSGLVHAQGNAYPNQRVGIVVGFAAGGPVESLRASLPTACRRAGASQS
jgi:tripartite-type tricarboxylate transporter receptor subunit TctC